MIVKRKRRATDLTRQIVRRTRPAVGVQRKVVKRKRDGGGAVPPDGPRFGRFRSWRPGRGAAIVLVLVAFVATLAGGGYAAYQSPYFEVSTVEVRGNEAVSAEAIAQRADLVGDRMFSADLGSAQRSVFAIPQLSSVRIERSWPDTIVVHVEEREPWGVWEQGGLRYTIDEEGVVISTTGTPAAPTGSPVILSSEVGSRQLGDRVDHHAVAVAAEIYELLPARLGTDVTEIAFIGGGSGVQVTTSDGQVALLGDSNGINYKLSVWEEVKATARNEGIDYTLIDLRFGNRPVLQ